jgi:hypothetical protein
MTEEEQAIAKARVLFDAGAAVVYVSLEDQERIVAEQEPPDRPGTFVTARTIHEVQRFVRDLKLDRKG